MSKIVAANFYPVYPVEHGGQRRIFFLARELGRDHDVTLVTLSRGEHVRHLEIAPSVVEIQVPAARSYCEFERSLHKTVPMTADVAYAMRWEECELYQGVLREQIRTCQLAVTEHPYSIHALRQAIGSRRIPMVYNSQNVEIRQKQPVLAGHDDLLRNVRAVEQAAIDFSGTVVACSDLDREHLIAEYAVPERKVETVKNGVDCQSVPVVSAQQREHFRQRLRLDDRFTAVFGGSFHFPNLAAVEEILKAAQQLPHIVILIFGSICRSPVLSQSVPPNILPLGSLPETEKWLAFAVSDLALNPMSQGSGSNIKMFEYAAAGLPTLSTTFGARGTGLVENEHYFAADLNDFAERLNALSRLPQSTLTSAGAAARDFVARTADWSIIGGGYRALVADILNRSTMGSVTDGDALQSEVAEAPAGSATKADVAAGTLGA